MDKVTKEFTKIVRRRLKANLRKIILFGSRARGTHQAGSDYDILLLLGRRSKKAQNEVLNASVEMLDKYNALIGTILCDDREWEFKKRFPIGRNILDEGVEL